MCKRSTERKKVNILEMNCLRNSCRGVSLMDTIYDKNRCRTAGKEIELASKEDQRVLRCSGHVGRIDE